MNRFNKESLFCEFQSTNYRLSKIEIFRKSQKVTCFIDVSCRGRVDLKMLITNHNTHMCYLLIALKLPLIFGQKDNFGRS